jgi:hypothetical protein
MPVPRHVLFGSEDAWQWRLNYGLFCSQLVSLQKYQIALRMTIEGAVSLPFLAVTLPPHKSQNQNREKVLQSSRQRYSLKTK